MSQTDDSSQALRPIVGIDRLIHEPARLMILALLYVIGGADFLFVLRQTGLTRGNLSSHMSKLENAAYIHVTKEFADKVPRTLLRMTKKGRDAFDQYRQSMIRMLEDLPE